MAKKAKPKREDKANGERACLYGLVHPAWADAVRTQYWRQLDGTVVVRRGRS